MHSTKCIGKRVVRPEKLILIGKVGELKCKSDDGDNDADTNKRNELIFAQKSFVIREELNANELICGTLLHLLCIYILRYELIYFQMCPHIIMPHLRFPLSWMVQVKHCIWHIDQTI